MSWPSSTTIASKRLGNLPQGAVEHIRQTVEVRRVSGGFWTDEPCLLPELLAQPMERADRDALLLTDGGREKLGQRPVEAGEQHLEALGRQAPRLLGGDERLARPGHAQDYRAPMCVEH